MRVNWGNVVRPRRLAGERGAVVVVVALVLVVLLSMVVLTVDVGGMLIKRRQMVRASDSAALAAAQSCATNNPFEALGQADLLATSNVDTARRTSFSTDRCDLTSSSGSVTARYGDSQRLFFAPVIGFGRRARIAASAKAVWGPAGGATVVPIELSVDPATDQIPCQVAGPGTQCGYWYDQQNNDFSNASNWGFINLGTWGTQPGDPCPNGGAAARGEQIINGAPVTLARTPTYVCVDEGQVSRNWYQDLSSQIGKTKDFPVNDPDQMIRSTSEGNKYAIIGFARFKIVDVMKGDDPEAYGVPGVAAASGECRPPITKDFSDTPSGRSYDLTADMDACMVQNAADRVMEPPLKVEKGNTTYVLDRDYSWDAASDTITWLNFPGKFNGVKIVFGWQRDAIAPTPGACGVQQADPNAVCLVLEYPGKRVGGTAPCTTGCPDFGLRAIRLDRLGDDA